MLDRVSCIIVDADAANRQELATFLTNSGADVAAALPAPDALPGMLAQEDAAKLVVVNLDPNPHQSLRRIGPWIAEFPAVSFFAMSRAVESSLLMEAIHLGVKEFISLPVDQDRLLAGVEKVTRRQAPEQRARVIHAIPAGGGCGCTTIACNVAATLAKGGGKTVLIDLDLVRGGVADAFNLRPRYTIADLMDPTAKLDRALLDNALAVHQPTGLSVLARPGAPEDARRVTREGLHRLLSLVVRSFDYVVIDSVMSADPLYEVPLRSADYNVLVMQVNVPCAKSVERFVAAMRRMGIGTDRVRVVANRLARKSGDLDPAEVEKALGFKISWTVPNDFKTAVASINLGEPVVLRAPRADLSESLQGLSHLLNGRLAATAKA